MKEERIREMVRREVKDMVVEFLEELFALVVFFVIFVCLGSVAGIFVSQVFLEVLKLCPELAVTLGFGLGSAIGFFLCLWAVWDRILKREGI